MLSTFSSFLVLFFFLNSYDIQYLNVHVCIQSVLFRALNKRLGALQISCIITIINTQWSTDHWQFWSFNWSACWHQISWWQVSGDCTERGPCQLPCAWGVCAPAPVPAVVPDAGDTGPRLHHRQLPWGDLCGHPPAQRSWLGRCWFFLVFLPDWCCCWTCLTLSCLSCFWLV